MANKSITVSTSVHAPVSKVWEVWNKPEHIVKWAFASDDWEVTAAENDLKVGGKFKTVMAAKDKSTSFDFGGTYATVKENELIEYTMGDSRKVSDRFVQNGDKTDVTVIFETENQNSEEMQRNGWQTILDNFKKYTESV